MLQHVPTIAPAHSNERLSEKRLRLEKIRACDANQSRDTYLERYYNNEIREKDISVVLQEKKACRSLEKLAVAFNHVRPYLVAWQRTIIDEGHASGESERVVRYA